MSARGLKYERALLVAALVYVAGIARDLAWHATHSEFEATSQQFEAHWLLWIGFLSVLTVTVLAFARMSAADRHPGFTVGLAASALYLPVSIWHFAAHASGSDPSVAHVLLAIGDVTILSGVAWVFTAWLAHRRHPAPSR